MEKHPITPFVKWAGGKRQLLGHIRERLPKTFHRYFEPFVGGGALLFELLAPDAVINDINKSLINAYRQIKSSTDQVITSLSALDEAIAEGGKSYYYTQRQNYNDKLMRDEYDVEMAALFIFINKHCFNGLYRVNGKGLFNVPYNNSLSKSFEEENLYRIAEYLKTIEILQGDFQTACSLAEPGDFIFFDSPYAPLNPSSFESYTKEGFDVESHRRLAALFRRLTEKGCYCMLTNHNTDFINQLYEGFHKDVVSVKRYINSDASNRKGEEIIITKYE